MSIASSPVSAIPTDASVSLKVDWLELVAFFSARGVARLDELENIDAIQQDEPPIDDASENAEQEDRRAAIENEIVERARGAGPAYPFYVSDDGEELLLKRRGDRRGAAFYLLCLIATHFIKSQVLNRAPTAREIVKLRKTQYQIVSTLAVAGHVQGPTVSIGWPRASNETLSQVLTRVCSLSGTGRLKIPPGREASRKAKDGGMDVIAWRVADDGRVPPAIMYFAQAASGHGWRQKSAFAALDKFLWGFFFERPACNHAAVTIVPFRLTDDEHAEWGADHGHILDRTRLPLAALKGFDLAAQQGVPVDELHRVHRVSSWIWRYRAANLTH